MTPDPGDGTATRVLGLETEYAIVAAHARRVREGSPPPLTPAEALTELFKGTRSAHRARNRYLPNGGRLYVDLGHHPEYATAECTRVADAVAQDRAGELLLREMAGQANERLRAFGIRLHILKNNVDRTGATFGCHENYQVERRVVEDIDPGLVAFLATRPVLTGGGAVARGRDGQWGYRLSARAPLIHLVVSPDPTRERPLIVTREEPLADADRYARLQVTYGDSNVADTTTALKLGLTAAVLDLLDHGASLADLRLADPVAALHAVAEDGPEAPVELASGRTWRALDVQESVLERCAEAASRAGVAPRRELALARRALDALRSGRTESVAAEIDWIGKKQLLTTVAEAASGDWASHKVARAELAYHDLDPVRGLAGRLRAAGLMASTVTDAQVAAASSTPPATRARVRGRFIEVADELHLATSVSWTHVRLDSPPRPQLDLLDPLAAESEDVEALIAEMRALPPRTFTVLSRLQAGLGTIG